MPVLEASRRYLERKERDESDRDSAKAPFPYVMQNDLVMVVIFQPRQQRKRKHMNHGREHLKKKRKKGVSNHPLHAESFFL
jgi:hypothetical protein